MIQLELPVHPLGTTEAAMERGRRITDAQLAELRAYVLKEWDEGRWPWNPRRRG